MPDRASMDQDYNDNYHQVTGNTKQDIKVHTRCRKQEKNRPTRTLHEISETNVLYESYRIHEQTNTFLDKCAISYFELIRQLAT